MDTGAQQTGELLLKGLQQTLQGGIRVAKTGLGQEWAGIIAKPVFVDLREIAREEIKRKNRFLSSDKAQIKEDKLTGFASFLQTFKNNFAIGDLVSVIGLGFLALQKALTQKNKSSGFFEGILRTVAMIMTLGGSLTAAYGRTFNLHKAVALGKDHGELMVEDAETSGRKIFTRYSEEDKKKLIEEAKKLDRVLIYPPGLRESVLERHEKPQGDMGGLFDGPKGVGKTAGVKCILGKWAERQLQEGFEPEIAELNLANFDEYLQEEKRRQIKNIEVIEALVDNKSDSSKSYVGNQGLMILEVLISKIQGLRAEINNFNSNNPEAKQKKLAIFIDEFDKIFDPQTLKGCDKQRLKNLLVQFNELFVKEDLFLTSNVSLEDLMKSLTEHLPDSKDTLIDPMRDRIGAKNRGFIDYPGPREQAEMISGRMLEEYGDFIDWQNFGLQGKLSGKFELDRKILGQVINDEITTKQSTLLNKMNGRQIKYACDDLLVMLLGKARQLRLEKNLISDQEWEKMSAQEKIARTGAKIDKAMVSAVLENKIKFLEQDRSVDRDLEQALSLVEEYIKTPANVRLIKDQASSIKKGSVIDFKALLDLLYTKQETTEKTIYQSKQSISLNGKNYKHVITRHNKVKGTPYSFIFIEDKGTGLHDFHTTGKFSASDFHALLKPICEKIAVSPIQEAIKLFTGVVGDIDRMKDTKSLEAGLDSIKNRLETVAA